MTDYIVLLVLFVVLGSPMLYDIVDKLFSAVSLEQIIITEEKATTPFALILHGFVFVGLYYVYKTFISKDMAAPAVEPPVKEHFIEEMENDEDMEEFEVDEPEEFEGGEGDSKEHMQQGDQPQQQQQQQQQQGGQQQQQQQQQPQQQQQQQQPQQQQQQQQPQQQQQGGQPQGGQELGGFEGFGGGMGAVI